MMNAPRWSLIVSVSVATLLAAAAGRAQEAAAVIDDHLECYKIMDPLKLAASVDLNSPQFGVDQNCEVGKAKLFCVPARKTVHLPSVPSPLEHMTGPDAGDRICYEVKCKSPGSAPDTLAADQFGARKLKKLKTRMLCTPAVKVKPGWLGRIEIDTLPGHIEQYWTDSDGVRPEAAGCHTAFVNKSIDGVCLTAIGDPGSVFGEFCLPEAQDGFPAGSLVESNPSAGVCHPHKNQKGHPDVYDCDAFCKGTVGPASVGVCEKVENHCGLENNSAYCSCDGAANASPNRAFLD